MRWDDGDLSVVTENVAESTHIRHHAIREYTIMGNTCKKSVNTRMYAKYNDRINHNNTTILTLNMQYMRHLGFHKVRMRRCKIKEVRKALSNNEIKKLSKR